MNTEIKILPMFIVLKLKTKNYKNHGKTTNKTTLLRFIRYNQYNNSK